MDGKELIKLISQKASFIKILNIALAKTANDLLNQFKDTRTLKIDQKLYDYSLNYSRRGICTDSEAITCITFLLKDENYSDPSDVTKQNAFVTGVYDKIKSDFAASYVRGGAGELSWIERIAGFVSGDEDAI